MNRTGFADIGYALDDFSRLQFVIQQAMNGLATATIVQVKAVDDGTVDVLPLVSQIDGKDTGVPHSTIHGMPYFALQAGASTVLLKPKVNDIGLAVFCHSDISSVKANKGAALPASRRRYSWADGIYLGGLPLVNVAPSQFIELDDEDGITVQAGSGRKIKLIGDVEITGNVEHTGNLHSSGTITGDTDVIAAGKSGKSHVHGGVQTGTGNSGGPA